MPVREPAAAVAVPWRRISEPVNTLSHLAGALLGLPALYALLQAAAGDPRRTVAFLVYSATLVSVYGSSAALHALPPTSTRRRLLRRLDHAAIYLFIAGTNTPLCVVTLRDRFGGDAFYLLWALALAGVVFKICWLEAPRWLSTASYLAVGALGTVLVLPLMQSLQPAAFIWFLAGVGWYLLGTAVFSLRRPNPWPGVVGHHELWHFLSLAGSACHYLLMLRYVA